MNYEKGRLSRCVDTYHYHDSTEGSTEGKYPSRIASELHIEKKTTDKSMTELFTLF